MYCLQCIRKWYPHLSENDIVDKCPFCRKTCYCNRCLHLNGLIETTKRELTNSERRRHLQYLIALMLPFLSKLSVSQNQEIENEAMTQGLQPFEVDVTRAMSYCDERVYCDHCATSIVDLHWSCPKCSFELCLNCCQEIREGSISQSPEMKLQYVNKGFKYMHGLKMKPSSSSVSEKDEEANIYAVKDLKQKHKEQKKLEEKGSGDKDIACSHEEEGLNMPEILIYEKEHNHDQTGSALWDIFRREDVPKKNI